jgi:molybdopterin molybdotransferase
MKATCETSNGLLPLENALKRILADVPVVTLSEKKSLKNALGRVLSCSIFSPINIPLERHSAMDGYAFSSTDIQKEGFKLTQVGISWAGAPFEGTLKRGQCVQIFTGAVLPEFADTVVMQENIQKDNPYIIFPDNCQSFDNVRQIGSDIQQHAGLLPSGKKLTAIDLGLLASAGLHSVDVYRQLRIAYFSTGDELIAIGKLLTSGKIYDSNRYLLFGLLDNSCIDAVDMGVIADDKLLLENAFLSAAKDYDVIISTGGASVGEADYIQEILAKVGHVNFWKVAIKPGKPIAFGRIHHCVFFGLPGNPVSVVATFDKLVQPALQKMYGWFNRPPLQFKAISQTPFKKRAGRKEYLRGILSQQADGVLTVISAGAQDSNKLGTLSRANCYIIFPADSTKIALGETVWVELFENTRR